MAHSSAFLIMSVRTAPTLRRSGSTGCTVISPTIGSRTGPTARYVNSRSRRRLRILRLTGKASLINHYFDAFPRFCPFDDVVRTLDRLLRRYRLAVVSNIDDDLLALTPLQREFDLVCTAQRAKGYKPDGALFRYLIEHAGCAKEEILHVGQSQFTDLVGGKPLGLTIAWIN